MSNNNPDYTIRLSDRTDPMPVIQENCYSLRQDLLDNAKSCPSEFLELVRDNFWELAKVEND